MDEFTRKLADLLGLPEEKALALSELLEERMREMMEDRLDQEHGRGDYRSDY